MYIKLFLFRIQICIFMVGFVLLPGLLFAQNTSGTDGTNTNPDTATTSGEAPTQSNSRALEAREQLEERAQNREERREQLQTQVEERRAQVVSEVAERRATLEARAQERLLNLAANMSNRMEAVIRRMNNVVARLESRIEKIAATGVDTSAATANVETAKGHLNSAATTLATIDSDVTDFITSNDPHTAWQRVRSIFESARTDLRQAHQALRAAVVSLGQARAASQNPVVNESLENSNE